jgi:MFS family permease
MHGLYLLWWVQEKQMSPAVVAAVLAAGDLALMGFEFPTGWFADRFGHRASLMLGSLVQVVGMLWCWLGEGVPGLVTASVLIALGDAFRSGADEALLYQSCLALNREDDFQRIEARARAAANAALVVMVLLGGVIVHVSSFAIGWLAETVLCFVGFGLAWAMVEPGTHVNRIDEACSAQDAAPVRYRELAMSIMPAALVGGAASAASFLAQTTGTHTAVDATVLVAAFTAAEAGGSVLAARLPAATVRDQIIVAVGGWLLFIAALAMPSLLALTALILGLFVGVAHPLRAAAIQRLVGDDVRARVASAASACDMAASTLLLPLAGVWRSRKRL